MARGWAALGAAAGSLGVLGVATWLLSRSAKASAPKPVTPGSGEATFVFGVGAIGRLSVTVGDRLSVTIPVKNTGNAPGQPVVDGITTDAAGVTEGHWVQTGFPDIAGGAQASVELEMAGPASTDFQGQTLQVAFTIASGLGGPGTLIAGTLYFQAPAGATAPTSSDTSPSSGTGQSLTPGLGGPTTTSVPGVSGTSAIASGAPSTSQATAQIAQLQQQAAAVYAQMASVSQQIQAREAYDQANGITVLSDPTIRSLESQWSSLSTQYEALQQQLAALGA